MQGTVTDGESGTVEGTIRTILCVDRQESEHAILIAFQGRYREGSGNGVRFMGTYEIIGGTGMFSDLTGHGSIKGVFHCLDPILARMGAENCEDLGFYSDFAARLRGNYADPTAPA
ncbi:MAG: hypothetical protein M3O70_09155 [Actinomycetota bacterium]|nr:hypothetical protein [Actinomycetota bacterium]